MASLLTYAEPAVIFEKRDEFFDFRWHFRQIVLGLRPVECGSVSGQLCAHERLCSVALTLPECTAVPWAQVLGPFARDGELVDTFVGHDC